VRFFKMVRVGTVPLIVWLMTAMVWGTSWTVIRIGLRDLPPFTFAAVRTVLAAVALLAVAQLTARSRRPGMRSIWFWIWVGLPQLGIPYALVFWAEQSITSGLTAMLFATFPAFTAVAAHFMLRNEPLTRQKVLGTLLAVVAVVLLVRPSGLDAAGATTLWAVLGVLIASVSAAIAAVLVRRHGRDTSTLWLTAIQVSSAAVFLVAAALILDHGAEIHVTVRAVGSILYLAFVVTCGCYLSIFWLLKRLDATFVSMSVAFETAFAVFWGAVLLSEPLGARFLVGLAFVVLSVVLVSRSAGVREAVVS
jgi:drug/metabolite transporter (DMT)-like permease